MATKKPSSKKAGVKIRDMKPKKDAKGGFQDVDDRRPRSSLTAVQGKDKIAFSASQKV